MVDNPNMMAAPVIVEVDFGVSWLGSLVPAGTLVVVAFLTYLFTLRIEHRRALREERLKAYEGYVAHLRSLQIAKKKGGFEKEQLRQILTWIDQLRLIGTKSVIDISRSQYKEIEEGLREADVSTFHRIINKCHREFVAVAREDMRTGKKA